MTASFRPSIRC